MNEESVDGIGKSGESAVGIGGAEPERAKQDAATGRCPRSRKAPRRMRLLEALVLDADVQAASAAAGVSRMTAYRWLRQPAFQDELARQRDAVLSGAMERVKTQAMRAVAELSALLSADDARLRRLVCNDILGHALRVRELEDIEKRLAVLEKAMEEDKARRRT